MEVELTARRAIAILARLIGAPIAEAELDAHLRERREARFDAAALARAAGAIGLTARVVQANFPRLARLPLPAIARAQDGAFFVIARADADRVLVQDPRCGQPEILDRRSLDARWDGTLVLAAVRRAGAASPRFGLAWFMPAIAKHRKLFAEVLVASFVLQLLALGTPVLVQVILDKVLVHRGFATLTVVGIGLVAVVVFEAVLGTLRTYVLGHTTSRIDVELGTRLYRHMLGLPLAYFEARRAGDTVARVRELEHIREFLTGASLTALLDCLFSVIFIGVMLLYSPTLTLIVLASIPVYAIVSIAVMPVLRRRLEEKFDRGAEAQAHLVETVNGIHTAKALAVERTFERQWDDRLAGYVTASFRATRLAAVAGEGIGLIGKIVTILILWIGAHLVIAGSLTIGALIAFNMLAARIAQPILRLARLWQDFQQVGISMRRMGDIMNTPLEAPADRPARTSLARIAGAIAFDRVSFRYRPDGPEVLSELSLAIRAGEVIGIVGRSGSGKSTLARLVQRLSVPERGRVMVDGVDLALADPQWLRRSIGVVPQESRLFARSVRENIALADPGMPLEHVIAAARLAGAHDFIVELPEGYDTVVGEQGATLSGGQRQRIAIARALATKPRILILDEATSALDYESERALQANMAAICVGRTVIIIAHRLSALRDADRIIVIERGAVVEEGRHGELKARPNGTYARLHALQQG